MVIIPSEIIERIRERASVADIIGESVQLKRNGRRLSGLCPFHAEKSPSFSVNEEEGFYHCFGCGKSGDVFKFIQETRSLSFPEAVRFLANRYGITVPEERSGVADDRREKRDERSKLRHIVQAAMEIFHETLCEPTTGRVAQKYLEKRGINHETIRTFHLGYAPAEKNFITERLIARLKEKGQGALTENENFKQQLIRVGLLKIREGETQAVDVFWERLIFPICRSDGSPIAFGGRLLQPSDTRPKYLNSPETPLYQKRQTLYGVPTAMPVMRKTRAAFLVEGYMDVISLHQTGFTEALATCGTAVTQEHVRVLKRLVDRASIVFDGDTAGRKAAANCFPLFLNSGIDVSAIALPDGEDPDSLAQKHGHEKMAQLLNELRRPLADVYLDFLIEELSGSASTELESSPTLAGKISERFAGSLRSVTNSVEREFLLRRAAERLGVSLPALNQLVDSKPTSTPRATPETKAMPAVSEMPPLPTYEESGYASPRTENRKYSNYNRHEAERVRVPIPRPRSSADKLTDYFRQLLTAVVCEPSLAAGALEIESLQIDPDTATSIPSNLHDFFSAVVKLQAAGSFEVMEDIGEREIAARIESFRALMEEYALPSEEVIKEALKQRRVGGSQPQRVVSEIQHVSERESLIQQVERIRLEESSEQDQSRLATLAQEKLLKRRNLDRLTQTQMQRPGSNPTK